MIKINNATITFLFNNRVQRDLLEQSLKAIPFLNKAT
jgi:hypothetical protein